MCLVIAPAMMAGLMLATSAASAAVGLAGQMSQANQQNQMYTENANNANTAAQQNYANLNNQLIEKRNAGSQQMFDNNIKAAQARATGTVAAGEAGVSGISIDSLLGDFYGQQGRRSDSIAENFEMDRGYVMGQQESIKAQTQSRINSVPRGEVTPLHLLKAGVDLAGGALGAGGNYYKMTRRGGNMEIET